MINPPVILLASGGLDSTTLAYSLVHDGTPFHPLFFDYGQHCLDKEWETLNAVLPTSPLVKDIIRINISDLYRFSTSRLIREADPWREHVEDTDLYIPYRTLVFFSASACIAQSLGMTEVYSAFINSNHAKELDCAADFLNQLDALSQNVGPVRFKMPFRNMSKAEVVRTAIELHVPFGSTYSCQLFSDTPCGACPNCVERINALKAIIR